MEDSKTVASPSEVLYDRCNTDAGNSEERFKKLFTQDDLLGLCDAEPLQHITSVKELMPIIEELANSMLFITIKTSSGARSWGLRPRDAAGKVKRLNREEHIVYSCVENEHENGIWIRNIKKKTGISDNKAMERIVTKLQSLYLIKNVKSARSPNQKTYMLYHLAPTDEMTGGSFFDAGELDEGLVDELSNLIVFHARQMSWVEEKKKRIKRDSSPILIRDDVVNGTAAGAQDNRGRKKRKREKAAPPSTDMEDFAPIKKHCSHKHDADSTNEPTQLIFPAGHEYPTASSIHQFIVTNNVIRPVKAASLTVDEIQNVLNVLVWDEKLEEVNGGYRTVRGVKFKQPGEEKNGGDEKKVGGNGLTEMPCGRCPVVDLCGVGGPISAETCVYFERWLDRGVVA